MDESKNPLPAWVPWATTASLAALLACVGELLMLEKARAGLLHDQILMTEAALKGAENQLEAERIVERREVAQAGASGLGAALLSAPSGAAGNPAPWGAVIWEGEGRRAFLRVTGLPDPGADGIYELWRDGPGGPARCASLERGDGGSGVPFALPGPVEPGTRFLLVLGRKGAPIPPTEALSRGPIVLATLPYTGKIPPR